MASSGMRSRIDCAMVLPVRIRMVKNTAARMRVTSAPMSPTCLAKPMANSFSGWVFVSSGEFWNSRSIAAEVARACVGSAMRTMYQPVLPLPDCRASSKYATLISTMSVLPRTAGSSASSIPTRSNSQLRLPSAFGWISELIGSFWPTFQPKRSIRRLPATAPVRARVKASRWLRGTVNSGYMSRYRAGSTAKTANALLSFWYLAPNQSAYAAPMTPGTASIRPR